MTKPRWELIHEWRILDIKFELEQIYSLKKMLIKHPDDSFGDWLRETIKKIKKCLDGQVKEYAKIYGDKPNLRRMREEVEK